MQTQLDHLNYLSQLGFTVNYWTSEHTTINEVIQVCQDPTTLERFNIDDIEYDGIVIKIAELDTCKLLGNTDHHPRR